MAQPEQIDDKLDSKAVELLGVPWFSHDAGGQPITRKRTCECGRPFEQTLLSERFLAIVERQSKRGIELMAQQIPGFWVPVFCPPCERRDLGYQARKDEYKQEPRAPYGDHADAAD